MRIDIQLLGGFAAQVGGEPVTELRTPAPIRLLSYLALHREPRPRRMFLAGLFWPESSDLRARRRLSHTLWVLQSALAPHVPSLIQADRDTIGLSSEIDVRLDVSEFERRADDFESRRRDGTAHLHADSLANTVDLYRGDVLADYYDDWIDPIRLRLREKYLLALENLVQLQKSNRDYGRALVSARRLVAETPLSEKAHGELIRLYWLAGRSDEAIAQYDACRRILDEELGVPPEAELTELRDRIATQRRPASPDGAEVPEADALIGRFEARRRLLEVVDSALGGSGGFALLEGQAGMGKTRLLADIGDAARWRGATVISARHGESSTRLEPYGAIAKALASELQGLRREQVIVRLDPEFVQLAGRVIPGLTDHPAPDEGLDASSPEARYSLHEALAQVLLALGAVVPTVVIVDDLQWADLQTLEFIRLVAPRVARSPVAFVLSYRTQEARNRPDVWHLLTDVEQRHPTTRVPLSGFGRDEIAALAAGKTSRPLSDETIDQLERSTGGNPLFVIETIRSMDRAARGEAEALPTGQLEQRASVDQVMEILRDEIAASPRHVQEVVGALAVWGSPAPTETIVRLTALETTDALDAIRSAIDAEFVAESDHGYLLRFEQLAAAAREQLSDDDERALHGRAGDLLTQDPTAPASELAEHYRQAEVWDDAARYQSAAATRAANLHSYSTAAHYYELALKSLENSGVTPTAGLLFGFEAVLDVLGRREEQAAVLAMFDDAELRPDQHVRLLQRRAIALAGSDDIAEAIRTASSALGFALAAGLDWRPAAVTSARVFVMAGHADLAARQLEDVTEEGSTAAALAGAQLALGQALTDVQEFDRARDLVERSLRIYRREGNSRGQVDALAAIAILHSQRGNAAAAQRHYHEAIALARQIGSRYGEGTSLANLALLAYLQGDAARSLGHMREAAEVFMAIDHRRGEAMVRANSANIYHAILGDDVKAEHEATAARRYFAEISDWRHEAQCLDVLAGVRRRKRAFAISRRLLAKALEMVRNSGDTWLEVQMLRSLAWTEMDAGNPEQALEVADQTISMCRDVGLHSELSVLLAMRAAVTAELGRHDDARIAVKESQEYREQTTEFSHVAAWWRHLALLEIGELEDARAELVQAHRILGELLTDFGELERNRSLARVGEHRAITDAYAGGFPRTEVVLLAPTETPTADPVVEVKWTVHHPDDLLITNKRDRRQRRLLRILEEAHLAGAHARLEDLANALDSSISTLKRDMTAMRTQGIID